MDRNSARTRAWRPDSHSYANDYICNSDSQPDSVDRNGHYHQYRHLHPHLHTESYADNQPHLDSFSNTYEYSDIHALLYSNIYPDSLGNVYTFGDTHAINYYHSIYNTLPLTDPVNARYSSFSKLADLCFRAFWF